MFSTNQFFFILFAFICHSEIKKNQPKNFNDFIINSKSKGIRKKVKTRPLRLIPYSLVLNTLLNSPIALSLIYFQLRDYNTVFFIYLRPSMFEKFFFKIRGFDNSGPFFFFLNHFEYPRNTWDIQVSSFSSWSLNRNQFPALSKINFIWSQNLQFNLRLTSFSKNFTMKVCDQISEKSPVLH